MAAPSSPADVDIDATSEPVEAHGSTTEHAPDPVPATPDPLDGVEGTVRAADGLMLRTLRWQPLDTPWANLLLVHGLGEHAGRYRHVGRRFAEAGIDVFAYDHRGFGGSAGPRAYVERWGQLHDDLRARIEAIRAASPDLPLVLYGHSMGGLVTLGYVLSAPRPPLPDRLVLSAPGLDSTVPRWKFTLARIVGVVAPRLRIANGFGAGTLCRDPAVEQRYAADPLNQSKTTTRFASAAEAEQQRVRAILQRPGRLPVATYVLHGSDDAIVPVGATESLDGRPNVTRIVHPGLRHASHDEPEGPAVVDAVIAWLRSELAENDGAVAPDGVAEGSIAHAV